MDRVVTTKFYRMENGHPDSLGFAALVRQFAAIEPKSDRERDTGSDVIVRLERSMEDAEFLSGEFCRIQSANIPPEVARDGLQPLQLPGGRGLGHLSAFLYHLPTRVIVWQENRNGTSKPRLSVYLSTDNPNDLVFFDPIISNDALQKLRHTTPKKFIFKFAKIQNVEVAEDPNRSMRENAIAMAQAFAGPQIEITVSMGRSDNSLDRNFIEDFVRRNLGNPELKKARVIEDNNDTPLDFITEHLQNKGTLDLPNEDMDENYRMRSSFLRETFERNRAFIEQAYLGG